MHDTDTTKLQLDAAGYLWVAKGSEPANQSTTHWEPAMQALLQTGDVRSARLLGTHRNAELIVYLTRRLGAQLDTLELASPRIVAAPAELNDPPTAIYRMRQCFRPQAAGGWHALQPHEALIYEMALIVLRATEVVNTSGLEELFSQHPLHRHLTFVQPLHLPTCAAIAAWVLDPRWHVSQANPERLSRIRNFLGLQPSVARGDGRGGREQARLRYDLVRRAWVATGPADMQRPGAFLHRHGVHCKNQEDAEYRGSQRFVNYFMWGWRQVNARAASGQELDMFLPDHIFNAQEAEAYLQHMRG